MQNMYTLLKMFESVCSQLEQLESQKSALRSEFYTQLQTQFKTTQKVLLDEMSALCGIAVTPGVPVATTVPKAPVPVSESIPTPESETLPIQEALPNVEPEAEELSTESFVEYMQATVDTEDTAQEESVTAPTTEVTVETESVAEEVVETETTPESAYNAPVIVQTGPKQWTIDAKQIVVQEQEITVTRGDTTETIKFSISPLEYAENGLVPLLVNANYRSSYGVPQATTVKSEENSYLLNLDINQYSFLIKGSFENGKFTAAIFSTGRSAEAGDVIAVNSVVTNGEKAPVPCITINDKTTLWISFSEDQYFGVVASGEWLDEYNKTHDAMIEAEDDYSELKTTKTESGWTLGY